MMAKNLSPAVQFTETDASLFAPAVSATTAGYAGVFTKGPCFRPVLLTSEQDLISIFGLPTDANYEHWFTVANFLQYSSAIYVVRAVDPDTALNAGIAIRAATTAGHSTFIMDIDTYDDTEVAGDILHFYAQTAGDEGDNIKIAIADKAAVEAFADGAYTNKIYANGPTFFSYFGNTVKSVAVGGQREYAVVVLDENNTILETFTVSLTPGTYNDEGEINYAPEYINAKSSRIYCFHSTTENEPAESYVLLATALSNGADGDAPAAADIQLAYDEFKDTEAVDITFLIGGGNNTAALRSYISGIADERKDCLAILDCESTDVVGVTDNSARVTNLRTAFGGINSKYATSVTNWKLQSDKYNAKNRWLPMGGDIAGVMARSADETEPWFAAAGFRRGQIKNVLKLAWNPNKTYRDSLHQLRLNSIVTFSGGGTVLFGQLILTNVSSLLNRVNVRMLLIYIEKALGRVLPGFLFQPNDTYTRAEVKGVVDGFMYDVQGRRGVEDPLGGPAFLTVCDTTNNTPEVIDRSELRVALYMKPVTAVENITVNCIVTRSGASFDEVVGRA
jgi:hypothetical protein